MEIKHGNSNPEETKHDWQPWQLRTLGFSLPWWLLLAPEALRAAWTLAFGADLPMLLKNLPPFCYFLLLVGVVSAMALASDRESSPVSSRLARWFLLGALSIPFVLPWLLTIR